MKYTDETKKVIQDGNMSIPVCPGNRHYDELVKRDADTKDSFTFDQIEAHVPLIVENIKSDKKLLTEALERIAALEGSK